MMTQPVRRFMRAALTILTMAAAVSVYADTLKGQVLGAGNADLLKEAAEAALNAALADVAPKAQAAFAAGDYTTSLQVLAALRTPADAFFVGVMVTADDPALRANRLGLLACLHAAMNQVADLSKLSA